ncbi:MAG: amino-acid N-acetyltransferase [Candidatus Marithrix sp.]|nr:amino-acid N-acetyltransferase [Candidatus Marithrix sp.]
MSQQFIEWFRSASPYIHAHRGQTFVICFGGEVVQEHNFPNLIHDIALLSSLGIKLVLVHGIRPQIEQCLKNQGKSSNYVNNTRVTDDIALKCVKAACGEVRAEIESLLSMGLTNSPTTDFSIYTASGNFITARPIGVRDGVDFCYTGEVRNVDIDMIANRLDEGCIVLVSPLGYSPTGETFNLLTEEVAAAIAIGLKTTKLIYLTENEGLFTDNGQLIRQLTLSEAQKQPDNQFKNSVRACQNGVQRVHLLSSHIEGALLLELFTRDGIGTLVSTNPYENIRKATIEDVGGILTLIEPLEKSGILVRRSREKLEMEIDCFTVQERDGMVVACAALYPFVKIAELACLAVHSDYQGTDRGGVLLAYLEQKAKQLKIERIFVLTTRTAHWFQERGFKPADLQFLPIEKREMYNYQRQSKVFVKYI